MVKHAFWTTSFQGLAKSLTEGLVSKGTAHCLCFLNGLALTWLRCPCKWWCHLQLETFR